MKRLLCLLLLVGLVAGCNGVIAKGTLAPVIQFNAANADAKLKAVTQPIPKLKDELIVNRNILNGYYSKATINWFAYAFGEKEMFVTATYYSRIQRQAALAKQCVIWDAEGKLPDQQVIDNVRAEWKWLVMWNDALQRRESAE